MSPAVFLSVTYNYYIAVYLKIAVHFLIIFVCMLTLICMLKLFDTSALSMNYV